MFATLITVALLLVPAIQSVVADFTIPTPELTQCQDAHITWDTTSGPYNLIVVPSDDPCGDPLADLGDHANPHMTWNVSLPAGSKVELSVQDSAGDEAWTGAIVIGASKDVSCLSAADQASLKTSKTSNTTSTPATTPYLAPSVSPTPASTGSTEGAGAINNAGSDPSSSAALTVRRISSPVFAMSAFLGAVTLLL